MFFPLSFALIKTIHSERGRRGAPAEDLWQPLSEVHFPMSGSQHTDVGQGEPAIFSFLFFLLFGAPCDLLEGAVSGCSAVWAVEEMACVGDIVGRHRVRRSLSRHFLGSWPVRL